MIACTISKVVRLRGAIAAQLDCDTSVDVPVGGADPRGVYVATATGLWRADTLDVSPSTLTVESVLMPAVPSEWHGLRRGVEIRVERGPDERWCTTRTLSEGDEAGTTMCFAHGSLVSGSAFWSGGSSREATHDLVSTK